MLECDCGSYSNTSHHTSQRFYCCWLLFSVRVISLHADFRTLHTRKQVIKVCIICNVPISGWYRYWLICKAEISVSNWKWKYSVVQPSFLFMCVICRVFIVTPLIPPGTSPTLRRCYMTRLSWLSPTLLPTRYACVRTCVSSHCSHFCVRQGTSVFFFFAKQFIAALRPPTRIIDESWENNYCASKFFSHGDKKVLDWFRFRLFWCEQGHHKNWRCFFFF